MEPQGLVKPLTTAGRDRARYRGWASIKRRNGTQPTLDQFKHRVAGAFPTAVLITVYGLMLIPLFAFLNLSAMRLYDIGKEVHQNDGKKLLGVVDQDLISGIDVVLGAEFAQIVFVIALKVLSGDSVWSKRAFLAGITLATLIALVGNAQESLFPPDDVEVKHTPFLYLITFAPPLIVLILGEVMALLWLKTIKASHEAKRLHEEALSAWELIDREPEQHPEWTQVFANVLREELCKLNKISVDDLTTEEWVVLINNELGAEKWYSTAGIPRHSMEPGNNSKRRSKRSAERSEFQDRSIDGTEYSTGGLVDAVEGTMGQAEKVVILLDQYPELLTMPRQEALDRLGVGVSTLYRAIKLREKYGNGTEEFTNSR